MLCSMWEGRQLVTECRIRLFRDPQYPYRLYEWADIDEERTQHIPDEQANHKKLHWFKQIIRFLRLHSLSARYPTCQCSHLGYVLIRT